MSYNNMAWPASWSQSADGSSTTSSTTSTTTTGESKERVSVLHKDAEKTVLEGNLPIEFQRVVLTMAVDTLPRARSATEAKDEPAPCVVVLTDGTAGQYLGLTKLYELYFHSLALQRRLGRGFQLANLGESFGLTTDSTEDEIQQELTRLVARQRPKEIQARGPPEIHLCGELGAGVATLPQTLEKRFNSIGQELVGPDFNIVNHIYVGRRLDKGSSGNDLTKLKLPPSQLRLAKLLGNVRSGETRLVCSVHPWDLLELSFDRTFARSAGFGWAPIAANNGNVGALHEAIDKGIVIHDETLSGCLELRESKDPSGGRFAMKLPYPLPEFKRITVQREALSKQIATSTDYAQQEQAKLRLLPSEQVMKTDNGSAFNNARDSCLPAQTLTMPTVPNFDRYTMNATAGRRIWVDATDRKKVESVYMRWLGGLDPLDRGYILFDSKSMAKKQVEKMKSFYQHPQHGALYRRTIEDVMVGDDTRLRSLDSKTHVDFLQKAKRISSLWNDTQLSVPALDVLLYFETFFQLVATQTHNGCQRDGDFLGMVPLTPAQQLAQKSNGIPLQAMHHLVSIVGSALCEEFRRYREDGSALGNLRLTPA